MNKVNQTAFAIVVMPLLALSFLFFRLFFSDGQEHHVIAYDCRLAEISPDYPQAVKVKCRQLMAKGGGDER